MNKASVKISKWDSARQKRTNYELGLDVVTAGITNDTTIMREAVRQASSVVNALTVCDPNCVYEMRGVNVGDDVAPCDTINGVDVHALAIEEDQNNDDT